MARRAVKAQKHKIPAEGDVFGVSLPKGGLGLVVVARSGPLLTKHQRVFAYVMRRRFDKRPSSKEVAGLKCHDVGSVLWLSLRPFLNGRWKRLGAISGFSRVAWPVPPLVSGRPDQVRDGDPSFAVELHDDEATPSVLANVSMTSTDVDRLPDCRWEFEAAPLEKGLAKALGGAKSTFWESSITLRACSIADVAHWKAARRKLELTIRKDSKATTDSRSQYQPGDLFAIPLHGGGFGVLLVARVWKRGRSQTQLFVCGSKQKFKAQPSVADVQGMKPVDVVYYGIEGSSCCEDGRWRYIGQLERFEAEEWFVPPSINRVRRFEPSISAVHYHSEGRGDEVIDFQNVITGLSAADIPTVHGVGLGTFSEGRLAIEIAGGDAVSGPRPTAKRLALWRRMNSLCAANVTKKNSVTTRRSRRR